MDESPTRDEAASTLAGQRTRDPAEQAELERLTGMRSVDIDEDALATGDDAPHRGTGAAERPPSRPEPAEAVVRRFLDARERRDYDEAAAETAEDVEWLSPAEGALVGRVAVREALAAAERDTDAFSSTTEHVEARGDQVVARVRNRGSRSGEQLDATQDLLFAVRDGAIRRVRIVVDDPAAVEAFWAEAG